MRHRISESSVASVSYEKQANDPPFATVTATLIAYGKPADESGEATAVPDGDALLVEHWVKPTDSDGLGKQLLVATTDGDLETAVSFTEFVKGGKPELYEHRLFLDEQTRAMLTSGDWHEVAELAVTGCIHWESGELDESDCEEVGVVPSRGDPPADFTGKSDDPVTGFPLLAEPEPGSGCYAAGTEPGYRKSWASAVGDSARASVKGNAWSNSYLNDQGAVHETHFDVTASVFNKELPALVDATARGELPRAGAASASFVVKALGQTLISEKYSAAIGPQSPWRLPQEHCVQTLVAVGPVPVTLRSCAAVGLELELTGNLLVDEAPGPTPFDAAARYGKIEIGLTPKFDAGLTAKAAVNLAVAEVGVEGKVSLLHAELPSSATLEWGEPSGGGPLNARVSCKTALDVTTMNGSLVGVWSVGAWKFQKKGIYPLMTFAGTTSTPFALDASTEVFCVE